MIYDKLENLGQYFPDDSAYGKALEFISDFTGSPGKYQLEGDSLFVNIDEYSTKPESDLNFESHKKYIDLQIMLSGLETHGVMAYDESNFEVMDDYSDEKDVMFMKSITDYSRILLSPGEFVIYFPGDCHKPGCAVNSGTKVRKAVAKILISD